MGFSLLDLVNKAESTGMDIKPIPVDKMIPSKRNFYTMSEIEALADSMRLFGDVQIGIVCPIPGTDQYRIIAGHRRREAHLLLMAEGLAGFDTMHCQVRDGDPDDDDLDSNLLLILTNSLTRELSDIDKIQQTAELKRILTEMRKQGRQIPGSLRKYIAEVLGVSETQVQRYETINNNLQPPLMEALKTEQINVSVAAELATEEPERQVEILEVMQERGEVSVKAAREVKAQKRQQPEPKDQEIITQNIDQKMYSQIIRHERAFIINKDNGQQIGQMIKFIECDKDYKPTGRTINARITVIDKMPGNDDWIVLGFRR